MPKCVVKWCKSHSDLKVAGGLTFHCFPREISQRDKWTDAVRKERREEDWVPTKASRVCSIHFKDEDLYVTPGNNINRLKKTAVPICAVTCGIEEHLKVTKRRNKMSNINLCCFKNNYGRGAILLTTISYTMIPRAISPCLQESEVPVALSGPSWAAQGITGGEDTQNPTTLPTNAAYWLIFTPTASSLPQSQVEVSPIREIKQEPADNETSCSITNERPLETTSNTHIEVEENATGVKQEKVVEINLTFTEEHPETEWNQQPGPEIQVNPLEIKQQEYQLNSISTDVPGQPHKRKIVECPNCKHEFYMELVSFENNEKPSCSKDVEKLKQSNLTQDKASTNINTAKKAQAKIDTLQWELNKLKDALQRKTVLAESRLAQLRTVQRRNKRLIKKTVKFKDVITKHKRAISKRRHL